VPLSPQCQMELIRVCFGPYEFCPGARCRLRCERRVSRWVSPCEVVRRVYTSTKAMSVRLWNVSVTLRTRSCEGTVVRCMQSLHLV